jgi:hypothetical protein
MDPNSGASWKNPPRFDFLIAFSSINLSMGAVPNLLFTSSPEREMTLQTTIHPTNCCPHNKISCVAMSGYINQVFL